MGEGSGLGGDHGGGFTGEGGGLVEGVSTGSASYTSAVPGVAGGILLALGTRKKEPVTLELAARTALDLAQIPADRPFAAPGAHLAAKRKENRVVRG
jgi:hypothetical protein